MANQDDITMLLKSSGSNPRAAEALYEAIYDQLRGVAGNQMRAERPDHTLQATALANEAYLKLIDQDRVEWQNRVQFFAVASRAIRRILVDHARRRGRPRRHHPRRAGRARRAHVRLRADRANPQSHAANAEWTVLQVLTLSVCPVRSRGKSKI